ncbi:magnesium transporter [Pandoraea iniqua]|nr:magnesium transporter [Pandoraea iniqua]
MLVNCVAYEDGRKIADLHPDEISDYLERPHCFVWVALKDPGPGELAQMQHEFGLHDLAVEDAQHGHQRPKIEQYGDSLFAVLHVLWGGARFVTVGEPWPIRRKPTLGVASCDFSMPKLRESDLRETDAK